jgi:type II secretory pathway pseudopilin PulG
MAIMGVLLAMVMGLSGIAIRMSHESKAKADIQVLSRTLEEYMLEKGVYPESLTDIEDRLPGDVDLTDPWGNPYEYSRTAGHEHSFSLFSMGPDGLHGSDTEDADDIVPGR